MPTNLTFLAFYFLLFALTLAGCGGGGNSGSTISATDAPPVLDPPPEDQPPEDPPVEEPPTRQVDRNFTYHRDTRDILARKCVSCHVEGDIAPFPLDTYEDVKTFGAAAAFAVRSGSMPPWPPTPGYTELEHDRSLTAQEKYILLQWLENGMEEGDPADYTGTNAASQTVTGQSGNAGTAAAYDMELSMAQPYTPFLQPDDHRCFAIEWPLDEFTYVTDVNVVPGVKEVVHHVIVSIAEPEDAHHYYAAGGEDGRPGWYCLGAGGVTGAPLPRQIGGWVPGVGREPTPEGTGLGVKPGSVMVVQMHYNTLAAEATPDQSTVQVAVTDSVQRPAHGFLLTNPNFLRPGGMPIPAGDPSVSHSASFPGFGLAAIFGGEAGVRTTEPWVMHQGFIHMHNLGVKARSTLIREDGSEQVLLDIRDWDFNWQGTYNFVDEVLVQPRDTIKLECTWDNSQANQEFVNGKQLETRDVEWGDGTQDEMCLMSVFMTRAAQDVDYTHRPSLHIESPSYLQAFAPGDLVPLELVLNNFSLHDPGEHDHDDASMHMGGSHGQESDDHSQVYEGHYHVYLDSDSDDGEHLTAWDESYYYQLPEEILPGIHELRVSLRGSDHHALGIEQRIDIEVLDVGDVTSESLVDVDDWEIQTAAEDSFASHRPESVECPDNSWYNEDGALEVETGYCNYLSLAQSSLVELSEGDTLRFVLWHGDLVFTEAASAHVAVSIDGKLVWESNVEIPTRAAIYDSRIELPFNAPAGSKVEYHLHNHGFNTWTLLKLEVER